MEFQKKEVLGTIQVEDGKVSILSEHGTNLFNSMSGSFRCNDFPYYFTKCKGDFVIRCKVSVQFQALYDLGCIVVYEDENKWMKLCYENSDAGAPAIVSVVTEQRSDDCNGEKAEGSVWLQIARRQNVFAMHWSKDKVNWSLVRIFALEMGEEVSVGVSSQCPTGKICEVVFDELEITENTFADLRKGM